MGGNFCRSGRGILTTRPPTDAPHPLSLGEATYDYNHTLSTLYTTDCGDMVVDMALSRLALVRTIYIMSTYVNFEPEN